MAKKTSVIKENFAAQSAEELNKFIKESRAKVQDLNLSLSAGNPSEKRALRRSIARALTALAQQ